MSYFKQLNVFETVYLAYLSLSYRINTPKDIYIF